MHPPSLSSGIRNNLFLIDMDNQQIFFNRIGSICSHAEEVIGTDLFTKITLNKATVNPSLTFPSTVLYLNSSGKLKMFPNYTFQLAQLRNDDWADKFIEDSLSLSQIAKKWLELSHPIKI